MKTTLLLSALLLSTVTVARAEAAPALGAWQGAYLGAGITWLKTSGGGSTTIAVPPYRVSAGEPEGTGGTLRLGYDWQMNRTVLGLGASYTFGNFSATKYGILKTKLSKIGSVYARAGYDMGRFMPYVLAGYTHATGEAVKPARSTTKGVDGYIVGLGVDYAIAPHWSTGLEWDYSGFGSSDSSSKFRVNAISLNVTYRF